MNVRYFVALDDMRGEYINNKYKDKDKCLDMKRISAHNLKKYIKNIKII